MNFDFKISGLRKVAYRLGIIPTVFTDVNEKTITNTDLQNQLISYVDSITFTEDANDVAKLKVSFKSLPMKLLNYGHFIDKAQFQLDLATFSPYMNNIIKFVS